MKGRSFTELERESQYLNANLEKIMKSIGIGDNPIGINDKTIKTPQFSYQLDEKARWTLDVIGKMQENRIGEPERLNRIKRALVENRPVDKGEVDYLKENFKLLKKVRDEKKKIQWTLDAIKKLQEYEVGDSKRLEMIKKALEEGRPVNKSEIHYLKEKYDMLQYV